MKQPRGRFVSGANDTMIHRLAAKAFHHVLSRKQCNYAPVLEWLNDAIERSAPSGGKELLKLGKIVKEGEAVFCGYKY